VSLDQLWAGWRRTYVSSAPTADTGSGQEQPDGGDRDPEPPEGGDSDPECVFCRLVASGPPAPSNGVLWRGSHAFAVLNAYPYASGHLMVAPIRHTDALDALSDDEGAELWWALRTAVTALGTAYRPEGINLGANLGQAAGAGIPRHLHLHALPRWLGDTNFMTAVAGVRVLPEALPDTWDRLHAAWPPA